MLAAGYDADTVVAVAFGGLAFAALLVAAAAGAWRRRGTGLEVPIALLWLLLVFAAVAIWRTEGPPTLISGILVAASAAFGLIFNAAAQRRDARLQRGERLRDLHRALFSEIGFNLSAMVSEANLVAETEGIAARMAEDEAFVPFVTRARQDRIFRTALEDLSILPRVTIDPVVAYYAQLAALEALAGDMRAAGFAALGPERRRRIWQDYGEMRVQAFRFGRLALYLIDYYTTHGKTETQVEAARLERQGLGLNRPSGVRSGR